MARAPKSKGGGEFKGLQHGTGSGAGIFRVSGGDLELSGGGSLGGGGVRDQPSLPWGTRAIGALRRPKCSMVTPGSAQIGRRRAATRLTTAAIDWMSIDMYHMDGPVAGKLRLGTFKADVENWVGF
eukprot:SAG22_NODE_8903_length_622_cov_1.399618_2_plen_125_part_01